MARLLILEDDVGALRALERVVVGYGEVQSATSVKEALRIFAALQRFDALIVDVGLPDGSGLEVLNHVRTQGVDIPALVITGHDDHHTISQAQLLGAQYCLKPWKPANVQAFLERELVARSPEQHFQRIVSAFANKHGLSPREAEIVRLASTGTPPVELPEAMGVSANTIKTLTRRMLHKTGAKRIDQVVRLLQRRALAPS